jgi:hypothetical protein
MTHPSSKPCTAPLSAQEVGAYLSKLVGTPWERKGLHCWRIVVQVQRDLFGRAIPFGDRNMVNRDTLKGLMGLDCAEYGWREVAAPEHGAVARMYRQGGDPKDLEHAGVYLALPGSPPLVLHTDNPHGVVLDTLAQLTTQRGWVPRWFVPSQGSHPNT